MIWFIGGFLIIVAIVVTSAILGTVSHLAQYGQTLWPLFGALLGLAVWVGALSWFIHWFVEKYT